MIKTNQENTNTFVEKRQNRVEDAIERLTEISADLNKMLAVHEQRISQQERSMGLMENATERRREEYETKLQAVYSVMNKEDSKIIDKLDEMKREQKDQHLAITSKIYQLEKIMWMYLGGFSVIVFLISYGSKILEFLK